MRRAIDSVAFLRDDSDQSSYVGVLGLASATLVELGTAEVAAEVLGAYDGDLADHLGEVIAGIPERNHSHQTSVAKSLAKTTWGSRLDRYARIASQGWLGCTRLIRSAHRCRPAASS